MTKRTRIFSMAVMIIFLSMPLYMDYLPASQELKVYFLDTPGIKGFFLNIPGWLQKAGMGWQAASKLYLFLMNILTCLVSYHCFHKVVSGKFSALAGSICYSFSVYSIYIRYRAGSIGETTAYALLPLCLYGLYMVYTKDSRQQIWRGAGLLTAGCVCLIYAHVPMALIVLAFVVLSSVLMGKKIFQKMRAVVLVIGLLGSVLLGLPVLRPYLQAVSNGVFYIHDNELFVERGLEIAELLTVFQVKATVAEQTLPRVSLGLPAVIVLAVCAIYVCLRKEARVSKSLAVAGVAILLSLRIFPWNTILALLPDKISGGIRTGLEHIGYPHRFLMIAVLISAFLVAVLGDSVEEWATAKYGGQRELILGGFLAAVIAVNVLSGVYYMNNLLYLVPMEDAISVLSDPWWMESDYLLYISK